MPATPRTTKPARRERSRESANRPRPAAPILIVGSAIAGNVLTLTFDQPVSLSGIPRFIPDMPGLLPVSAARTGPTTVAITYSGALASIVSLNIGFRDPAIRNASGGYVTSDTVIL